MQNNCNFILLGVERLITRPSIVTICREAEVMQIAPILNGEEGKIRRLFGFGWTVSSNSNQNVYLGKWNDFLWCVGGFRSYLKGDDWNEVIWKQHGIEDWVLQMKEYRNENHSSHYSTSHIHPSLLSIPITFYSFHYNYITQYFIIPFIYYRLQQVTLLNTLPYSSLHEQQ